MAQNFLFKTGVSVVIDKQPSRIMRIFDDGRVQIEIEADGTLKYSSREELLHLYSQNRLQFSGGNCDTEGKFALTRTARPLHSFPDSVQNRAIRRKRYLDLIRSYGSFNSSPTVLGPLIEECAKQIKDSNPPSRISVWRWHKKFIRSEFDHRVVIDRHDLKGGRGSRLHPVVQEALQEVIDEIYLNNERNSGEAVYSALRYRIDKKNEFLAPTQRFNIPSKSTIYRAIASLDKYDTASARLGPRIAQMKFRTSGMGKRPTRILERVEIDHTPLDLFVIDEETGLPQGRPTVTLAIDVYSKMPVGMHIGFSGTSIESVFACLRHALIPKTYIKKEYPEIENDWPCYGHIETLVCDNGLEFHSGELERVAFELGTQIQFCPKRQAYYKGSIERFLKTVNHQFSRMLPGHSFAKWFQREDYDPQKHAVVTFNQLMRYLHRWLIDVYMQSVHRGINTTPYQKWTEGMAAFPPKLLSDISRLDIALGRTEERTVFHYGIELNNVRYNGPMLLTLRRQHGEKFKTKVRYYFGDISKIHVIDPITGEPMLVPAVDQQYTEGLSLEQHRLICVRARQANEGVINLSAIARAKSEIREIIRELSFSKAQRKRARAAKLKGVGQCRESLPLAPAESLPVVCTSMPSPFLSIDLTDLPEFSSSTLMRFQS